MKGLQLSRLYFEACGKPMMTELVNQYPELKDGYAAGLVGHGSECFGFDDDLSRDHDFGPSFCLWLSRPLFEKYGKACQEAYDRLPKEFAGVSARREEAFGKGRTGVLCLEDFYYGLIGSERAPENDAEWMALLEERAALAVNGEVFTDGCGQFSAVRNALTAYYPEDVRKKKIAARAALMAQSGQYNYSRLCRRGEWTAAFLALQEFIKSACSMVHLLNRSYTPYYKWMHRSLKDLPVLSQIYDLLDQLTAPFDSRSAWSSAQESDFLLGIINTRDTRAVLIETVCQLVIRELERQELTDAHDLYLEAHAVSVMEKIQNPSLRSLQLMEG